MLAYADACWRMLQVGVSNTTSNFSSHELGAYSATLDDFLARPLEDFRPPGTSVYLLYQYKRKNTDAKAGRQRSLQRLVSAKPTANRRLLRASAS
jgi:hypothetical protein